MLDEINSLLRSIDVWRKMAIVWQADGNEHKHAIAQGNIVYCTLHLIRIYKDMSHD